MQYCALTHALHASEIQIAMASSTDLSIEQAVESVCAELGYTTLKDKQKQVIVDFVSGRDVFAALPTGYGKSLCYGCLPGVFDQIRQSSGSIVIVVSPLLALMKDQVDSFAKRGVSSAYVSSEQEKQCVEMREKVIEGKYQLVYISPEQLIGNPKYRSMCQSEVYVENLVALVIDEAHCVKKWYVICMGIHDLCVHSLVHSESRSIINNI